MLKRRRRIQKYIKALKNKKRGLTSEDVEQLKMQDSDNPIIKHKQKAQIKRENEGRSIQTKMIFGDHQEQMDEEDQPVWLDQDEELNIPQKNMFRKLQLDEETTEQKYEDRLRKFYNSKYGLHNWAVAGEGEYEEDLNDLLNHEEIYAHGQRKKEALSVEFLARTTQKHNSVVTGLDWKGQVVASCGYDQKLKLWSLKTDETNPQLRLKLQKDIYIEGFALSNCIFRKESIILGTLRQNYISLDCQKWKINKVSSTFLNVHQNFQNIRSDNQNNRLMLFSDNKISILDKNNSFEGSLIAGQPLEDVQFGSNYQVIGVSKDCLYEWDLRMWRLSNRFMKYNAFTKLWTQGDTLAIGNKLGVVSLSTLNEGLKQYAQVSALVTHVTDLKGNKTGDLLVQCSKWKQNAVRIIDIQKGRVISGWPAVNTKIGLPTVSGFSSSNQLAIANSHGYLSFYNLTSNQ